MLLPMRQKQNSVSRRYMHNLSKEPLLTRRLLPAPRKITSMTMCQGVTTAERSMTALRAVVATGAWDALWSSNGLLCRVQQTIQHLADRAVFAIERIRVHGRSLFKYSKIRSLKRLTLYTENSLNVCKKINFFNGTWHSALFTWQMSHWISRDQK